MILSNFQNFVLGSFDNPTTEMKKDNFEFRQTVLAKLGEETLVEEKFWHENGKNRIKTNDFRANFIQNRIFYTLGWNCQDDRAARMEVEWAYQAHDAPGNGMVLWENSNTFLRNERLEPWKTNRIEFLYHLKSY